MNYYSSNTFETPPEVEEQTNYWDVPAATKVPTKKKSVSFNDILSNMQMIVDKNGVLQHIIPKPMTGGAGADPYAYDAGMYNQPMPILDNGVSYPADPVHPSVKHSYIYNKYFANYADPHAVLEQPAVRVPKTLDEYARMLLDDKRARQQERERIARVKSTKMLYTQIPAGGGSCNAAGGSSCGVLRASSNSLRTMNLR